MISLLAVGSYYAYLVGVRTGEFAVGTLFALVAIAIVVPIVKRLSSQETDFDLSSIAFTGLALRLVGAVFRYNDASDAIVYWRVGVDLAPSFRRFQFTVDTGREIPGTGTLRYMSGLAQVITGDNMFATYIIWTLFCFGGAILFYRAFALAVPDGDRKKMAALIFCWPSLVYWPSSLGKEGWMLFAIGVSTLGVARYFRGQAGRGLLLGVAGAFGVAMVRPHVAIIIVLAFAGATMLGSAGKGGRVRGGAKILAAVVLLLSGALLSAKAAEFFKVDSLGTESVGTVLEGTVDQTTQDSGAFEPALVQSPADYPKAFLTVLFRPWLFEGKGFNDRLTAVEGTVLLGLIVASRRNLLSIVRKGGRRYMALFASFFVLAFVYAFSAIGNFGILARQRVQVLPFLLMLLCLPVVASRRRTARPNKAGDEVADRGTEPVADPEPRRRLGAWRDRAALQAGR